MKSPRAFALIVFVLAVLPAAASAQSKSAPTGGAAYAPEPVVPDAITVPGSEAKLLPDGTAAAPADAPVEVQQAIFAANGLHEKPYIYGGGHRRFEDRGYDCSGTVSYALHAGGLLDSPLDSSSFMHWGERGKGDWITVYTNPGHAYTVIAGLRLDTSSAGRSAHRASKRRRRHRVAKSAFESGPRWRVDMRSRRGFRARHPLGF